MSFLYSMLAQDDLFEFPTRLFSSLTRHSDYEKLLSAALRVVVIGAIVAGIHKGVRYFSRRIDRGMASS